jgi:transposase
MDQLPDDIATLRAFAAAALVRANTAEAGLANAKAEKSGSDALIVYLKLEILKLRRELYGSRSERKARLLEQLELQLEDLETTAGEDEVKAEHAAARTTTVQPFKRQKPTRKAFPEHLPRERVVLPAPASCPCCGSDKLSKLGETVTETLEIIPRQWKVVQTVREKFSCRQCETITQPPAPFHVIPRGLAGPSLLAMVLFDKFGQHQPLNRQSERFALEGIDLSLSTLADHVGACTAVLKPLHDLIEAHVMNADRLHGDDTTVPVLAKGKTDIARAWVYVRDDRPFAGKAAPAAVFYYSRDRGGEHPEQHLENFAGILQADAYAGYNHLYAPNRKPGPITDAQCWAHGRRKFFVLADIAASAAKGRFGKDPPPISPLALEAVKRIDALFDLEREINGKPPDQRLAARREHVAPLAAELETWMRIERARVSGKSDIGKAMDYMLKRWDGFTRFLHDGRICLTNNAAERAMRGIALGRKSWLFCGSDRGGQRAAVMYTLIVTAKMNDIDPQAWLADVLTRIADIPQTRLHELLPWNWKVAREEKAAA